ncbi:MAG: bifunctional oligoribonuclease/PAP phosphatase NrnA [Clostridiales bacterium]|jgi:phosphoesterase RecJ-like protein|nr:bifunctional oligoribonuclease/PAP phosphatase NrnA [Clostridiales bacterium]
MFSRFEAWNNMTKNGDNIVVASHPTPDGDAIGSSLALALALHRAGKNPVVILDKYAARFDFLEGREFIYQGKIEDLTCDVFIAVDCGDKIRVGEAEELFNRAPITINIDHHINNTNFARLNYVDTNASATSEVVFTIINMHVPINKSIAEALYMGIVTDTGGFRHLSTTAETMEIAALLMRTGIDFSDIQRRAIYSHSHIEAQIFAKAIQKMKFVEGYPIVYTVLTQSDLRAVHATYSDLDGIAEYMLNTEDAVVSAFFTERLEGKMKVSFRSANLDVRLLAEHFGGGGHKFAAAGNFTSGLDEGVALVLDALKAALDNK